MSDVFHERESDVLSYSSRKSGKSPAGERERVVVEVLVVEVSDVPIDGLAVFLEEVAVQAHVALESAVEARLSGRIQAVGCRRSCPSAGAASSRSADGRRVVVAGALFFDGDGFQAMFGAGKRGGIARRP